MGASGCGKTTLLNYLAHRVTGASQTTGSISINGNIPTSEQMQHLSSYVEQDDTLIGSLTAYETLHFAAKLSVSHLASSAESKARVETLLKQFGLVGQRDALIGTALRKGISGGQKRRVSVASQLIAAPRILFLDEPTSGLDSAASHKVMQYIKDIATKHRLLVIASIHQPSTKIFEMFDKVLLLSGGKTCYYGTVDQIEPYFGSLGYHLPNHMNPAEFILDLTNVDFEDDITISQQAESIKKSWATSGDASHLSSQISAADRRASPNMRAHGRDWRRGFSATFTLIHRSFIKSRRDFVVYGIRFAMYLGLGIMMGTVWLRLPATQTSIQPFINAMFFCSAFMSFMAVTYVPAFIEDHNMYIKDHGNGLYGSVPFMVSNFLLGMPYLFLITMTFSVVCYFLSNFRPDTTAFFTWVAWLFMDLLAAESIVVLVAAIIPKFVGALAIVAFASGLWTAANGSLVPPTILNVFYRYVFTYIDYQAYVFRAMMVNEFGYRTYDCGPDCDCMYNSPLRDQCMIDGNAVLDQFGYGRGKVGKQVAYMLLIILVLRLLGWVVLRFKR
jgi:ABC-type multidrug transport system ATPase subunit